jgi:hypothetical protein
LCGGRSLGSHGDIIARREKIAGRDLRP